MLALVWGMFAAQPASGVEAPSAPIRLVAAHARGLVFEFRSPSYQVIRQIENGRSIGRIEMAGALDATTPGQLQLPQFVTLLGIPAQATPQLRVVDDQQQLVPERIDLATVPQPAATDAETLPMPRAAPAPVAAVGNVELSNIGWMGDQRVAGVVIRPFYRNSNGQLVWQRYLRVELRWPEAAPLTASVTARPASAFNGSLRETLLNPDSAAQWRRAPVTGTPSSQPGAQPQAAQSFASNLRLKIAVDRDGLYQIRAADLQAAGFPLATLDPRRLRLTSRGQDIAIDVRGEADGRFDANDLIVFWGEQFRERRVPDTLILDGQLVTQESSLSALLSDATTYTDDNVYWLSVGAAPGLRMATTSATPGGAAPVPTFFRDQIRAERSNVWWTRHWTSRDPWFWERVQTSSETTREYPITLGAIAPDAPPAVVRGEVMGRQLSTIEPDHHTRFFFNDTSTLIEDTFWDGYTRRVFEGQVPPSALREGENKLLFNMLLAPQIGSDVIYFDWFEVQYGRQFVADQDQLIFGGVEPGRWQYEINGFSNPSVAIYDVSEAATPQLITGNVVRAVSSGFRAAWEATFTAGSRYAVAATTGLLTPKTLTAYTPPDLRSASNGADYLVITPREFRAAADELAAYRAGEGLRTRVVELDDVINEFNDGIYHPLAIKRFLAYAYARWQAPAPSYAVLIGDGNWGLKGAGAAVYGTGPQWMPPNLAWVDPIIGEVDSANILAAIVGDDILPDLAISRMPVNSNAELAAIVAKIKRFEAASEQPWQKRAVFVADNTPDEAGDFAALSDEVINAAMPADWTVERLYLNDLCGPTTTTPATCTNINTRLIDDMNNTGSLFLNYVGHASFDWWASEGALNIDSLQKLNNGANLPIILSMTCLDGYWSYPNRQGLIESFLRADNRGIVASFSPTGYGVANGHDVLHRGFYDAIFKGGARRLGAATLAAKVQLFAVGGHDDLIHTFTIFGDPALRLPIPLPEPTPEPSPILREFLWMPLATGEQ